MNKYKLINPTLNVSLFFTGKYKYFFNLHVACKLGQYQWNRARISQYKTAARVVFDEEQTFYMLEIMSETSLKGSNKKNWNCWNENIENHRWQIVCSWIDPNEILFY